MGRTRKLDPVEIRVLGVLLEKEQATPDQYPLTTNAVIAGSNQKTNREPVTRLTETEVVEALDRLRREALVWRPESARAERWKHSLDRRWQLDPRAKALMTLLLLRGPQTAAELRTRSEKLYRFESVEQVEKTLQRLAEGYDALVCELPRRPGQRETRWMHLESAEGDPREATADPGTDEQPADEAEPAAFSDAGTATPPPAAPAPASPARCERIAALEERLAALEETVAALQQDLQALRRELGA